MLDPKLLAALAAVVDAGGFERAAQHLFLSQSAISQRIRLLEEHVGLPVVTRTQPAEPTEAGRLLLQHARQLALLETELMQALDPAPDPDTLPRLALGVNADSLATWFLDALQPFLDRHRVLVELTDDHQDHTRELMRSGHVSACISGSPRPLQGAECIRLGSMRYLCVATPAFRDRFFADGVTHANLARAPAIAFDRKDDMHQQFLESALGYAGPFPAFRLPSAEGFVKLTLAGHACALIPELMIREELACGTLVDLCPGHHVDVPLYWHRWRVQSTLALELATTLQQHAATCLRP